MSESKADLMLHPIRLRILTTVSTHQMTAGEISSLLPDIPQTTLYRHINQLVGGGLLQIVEEKPIRGTIERTYTLTALPSLKAEDIRGMTKQQCDQAFTMFLSTLITDARQYLKSKPNHVDFNPIEDGVEINKGQLYLTNEEFQSLNSKFLNLMLEVSKNKPGGGRRRRILTYIFIPQE